MAGSTSASFPGTSDTEIQTPGLYCCLSHFDGYSSFCGVKIYLQSIPHPSPTLYPLQEWGPGEKPRFLGGGNNGNDYLKAQRGLRSLDPMKFVITICSPRFLPSLAPRMDRYTSRGRPVDSIRHQIGFSNIMRNSSMRLST